MTGLVRREAALRKGSGLSTKRAPQAGSRSRRTAAKPAPPPLAVVAIGASAGGLDALEKFFDFVPNDTGAAYVIIQHLDPNFRSMMDELLSRHSTLPIRKAETGMVLEPNVIYLNPARQEMRLEDGRLRLFPAEKVGGLNLPINSFFASAAAEFGGRAIGVILSGTGSDGTKGCEALKRAGGGVFVQEPASAKFDSMPASVMAKNLADGVAPPEKLPELIAERLTGAAPARGRPDILLDADPFNTIFAVIKSRYDVDFSVYKHPTMERRIRRRMGLVGCVDMVDYADFLAINREEVANLFNDLLVDVTAFFRDAEAFQALSELVVRPLIERIGDEREIRVWVAGCSSGEEAYSIAICFVEAAEALGRRLNLKILATDIHAQTLAVASAGLYPAASVASLQADLVERYFEREGEHVRIRKSLRRLIVFSQHNILKDPPFARIDLLSCRNVLIYFDESAQKFALNLFHFCLVSGGVTFLGPSESLGDIAGEFKTVNQKWRIFSKARDIRLLPAGVLTPRGLSAGLGAMRAADANRAVAPARDLSRATFAALKELLARFAPPGFLLARDGSLLHIFGDASRYIDLKPGVFSQKIADMLPRELALVVANGLGVQARVPFPKFRRSIRRATAAGERIEVVTIEPVSESEVMTEFLLLTIETREDKPRPVEQAPAVEAAATADEVLELRARNQGLLDELQSTEENLQSAIEELATSNEELQSTNEELMASNEELQSTNEELHSVNEELYSVTSEHQRKIDELIQVTLDMEHLLKATEIGTIFLDEKKHVRRYTPAAAQAFNLIPHDVGRPISHITVRFDDADFHALLNRVSQTREMCEKEVSVGGRGYLLRILPYRVDGEDMQGFVVTLVDIDKLRRAQAQVRELDRRQRTILASMQDSLVSWDARTNKITFCNQVFASVYETSPSALVDHDVFEVLSALAPETISHVREAIEALKTERKFETLIYRHRADGSEIWRTVIFAPVQDDNGETIAYVACGRDVSEQVRHVAALKELTAIEGDLNLPLQEAIRPALEIGLRILGLDRALASEFVGDHHRVLSAVGAPEDGLAPGSSVWLPHDLCNKTCGTPEEGTCRFAATGAPCWPRISPGAEAHAACPEDGDLCEIVMAGAQMTLRDGRAELVETEKGSATYIGIRPQANGKVYAAVSFFSDTGPKFGPLTNIQRGFVKQIAQWIGLKIEAHNAHQALLRNEGKLRLLFDSVPQSIWLVDAERRVLRANRAAAETVGRTPDEVVGMDIDTVLAPLDAGWRERNDEALRTSRASYNVLTQTMDGDGAIRWTSTDRIPYRDAASDESAMLLIVTSDITQLKAREMELSAANAALDASQVRFERLYQHTPVMMCSFLADRSIVVASDALLAKTGRARDDVIGRDICDLLDAESRETLVNQFLPSLAQIGHCQGALRVIASDQSVVEVEFSAFAETESEPEPSYLCVLVDVTARNRAQDELQRANLRLASANEGLEKFAHVASHDLQEPLRKISVFGKILADEHAAQLNEEGRHCLDVMTDAAVRMRDLVHNILAFSYANNAQADVEDIHVDAVVNEVVNELDASIRANAAIVVSAGLPVVRGDLTGVQQLFRNLLSNAIKYRRAEVDPRVAITAHANADGDCVLRVRDNGRGIEASQQALIFQPFTRLQPRSKIAGSGLGLAICKSVCDRRGWTISVESEPGVGTTFDVVVPARDLVAEAD